MLAFLCRTHCKPTANIYQLSVFFRLIVATGIAVWTAGLCNCLMYHVFWRSQTVPIEVCLTSDPRLLFFGMLSGLLIPGAIYCMMFIICSFPEEFHRWYQLQKKLYQEMKEEMKEVRKEEEKQEEERRDEEFCEMYQNAPDLETQNETVIQNEKVKREPFRANQANWDEMTAQAKK